MNNTATLIKERLDEVKAGRPDGSLPRGGDIQLLDLALTRILTLELNCRNGIKAFEDMRDMIDMVDPEKELKDRMGRVEG